jgi:hypothetical protein
MPIGGVQSHGSCVLLEVSLNIARADLGAGFALSRLLVSVFIHCRDGFGARVSQASLALIFVFLAMC